MGSSIFRSKFLVSWLLLVGLSAAAWKFHEKAQEAVKSSPTPLTPHAILKPEARDLIQKVASRLKAQPHLQPQMVVLEKLVEFQTAYNQAREKPSDDSFIRLSSVRDELQMIREGIEKKPELAGKRLLNRVNQAIALMATMPSTSGSMTATKSSGASSPTRSSSLPPLPPELNIQLRSASAKTSGALDAPAVINSVNVINAGSALLEAQLNVLKAPIPALLSAASSSSSSNTGAASGTCSPTTLSNPSPTGDALTAKDVLTARSSAITKLAQSLGTPLAAYQFVRDQIHFLPRYGATQTAEQVMTSGRGTSADKATLLIALLRAQGVPAQYLMGELQVPSSQLQSLYGVMDLNSLVYTHSLRLPSYFTNASGAFDSSLVFRSLNGQLVWTLPEVWVRAYIGKTWISLDPIDLLGNGLPGAFALSSPPVSANLDAWFFSPDSAGNYVKSGTVADQMVRQSGAAARAAGGSTARIEDFGVTLMGERVTPRPSGFPTQSVGVVDPCIEAQASLLPSSYQFMSHVVVGPASAPLIQATLPSAQVRQDPLALTYSTGLRAEGAAAGLIQISIGDSVLGSAPAALGSAVSLYNDIQFPSRYFKDVFYRRVTPNVFAGDVQVINNVLAPVVESDLDQEIAAILALQAKPATTDTMLMVRFLRLAGLMADYGLTEIAQQLDTLESVGSAPLSQFTTGTVNGRIVDLSDRVLGQIPYETNIDLPVDPGAYPRFGDHPNYLDYANVTQFVGSFIAASSSLEHQIWEELYGVPSVSTVRILQQAADGFYGHGTGHVAGLIRGALLNPTTAPQVFAQFGPGMDPFTSALVPYENPASILYSVTDTLTLDTGWSGIAMFLQPTSPLGASGALIATFTQPVLNSATPTRDLASAPTGASAQGSPANPSNPGSAGASQPTGLTQSGSSTGSLAGGAPILNAGGTNAGTPVSTPVFQTGQASNSPSNPTSASCGAPVVMSTGAMWHEFTDFVVPGRTQASSLSLHRVYMTQAFSVTGDFGPRWVHNWDTRLISAPTTTAPAGSLYWIDENGGEWLYTKKTDGSFAAPAGQFAVLAEYSNRYVMTKKGGISLEFSKNGPEPTGRLRSLTDSHAQTVTLTYDSKGRLARVAAPFAGGITFTRDASGKVTQVLREREGFKYQFQYDAQGRLSSSKDFLNRTTSYAYNATQAGTPAFGLLSTITDPIGRKIQFAYYNDGRAYRQSEPGNAQRSFLYAPFLYDRFTRILETDGSTTEFHFDPQFRTQEIVAADGGRRQLSWDSKNNLSSTTDELGYVTQYGYDSQGNLTSLQKPEDPTPTRIAYDPTFNLPTRIVPPAGSSETELTRDPRTGDVLKVQRSDGATPLDLAFTYDAFGNPLSITSNRGSYAHKTDANGLLTFVFDSRNPETRTYDAQGRVKKRKFQSGRTLSYTYDSLDQIIRVDDSAGPSLVQTFDLMERLITRTWTDGKTSQTTTYGWDERDRLVLVKDPLGRVTTTQYENHFLGCKISDRPQKITDPNGHVTTFEYDNRQRLVRQTNPVQGVIRYEYNQRGDLTALTDANNNRTTFLKDGNQRLVQTLQRVAISSGTGSAADSVLAQSRTRYKYDAAGRLIRKDMGLNSDSAELALEDLEYDFLDRLVRHVQSTQPVSGVASIVSDDRFTYQQQLMPAQLASANNGVANEGFEFEALPPYALTGFSLKSADASRSGDLIEGSWVVTPAQTAPFGAVATAQTQKGGKKKPLFDADYDDAGRLASLQGAFEGNELSFQLKRDGFGRRTSIASSDRLSGQFDYDRMGRLSSLSWGTPFGFRPSISESLSYDPAGNILKQVRELGTFNYSYDAADQLLAVDFKRTRSFLDCNDEIEGKLKQSWQLDLVGNHIQDSRLGTTTFLANQILQDDTHDYFADAQGLGRLATKTNRATGRSMAFSYRPDGKLVALQRTPVSATGAQTGTADPADDDEDTVADSPQFQAQYSFDALGRRLSKRIIRMNGKSFTQSYLYMGDRDQILLGQAGDGKQSLYLDDLGRDAGLDSHLGEVSKREGGKAYAVDHLGSVLNGEAAGDARVFSAYGRRVSSPVTLSASSQPVVYGFAGRQLDREAGLYYNRARMYAQQFGRFLSIDPIFPLSGPNPFAFANNSPLRFTDPSGLVPGDIFSTAEGAAKDFAGYINPTSNALNLEFAGWIYQNQSGYTYTVPNMGTRDSSNPGQPPAGYQSAIHTHGGNDPAYTSEYFSPSDVMFARSNGVDVWVATPKGQLNRFDSGTGETLPGGSRNACGP